MGFDSPLGYKMKHIHFHIGLLILLAAGLLAGCCHKDEPAQRNEIAVKTGVTGMLRRATTIDSTAALRGYDLKIDAYYHGTNTAYLSGKKLHYDLDHDPSPAWVFWDGSAQEHYYWPAEGSKIGEVIASTLDFVGACPFSAPAYITPGTYNHTTGTSFSCDMSGYMTSTAQTTMQEYIIAVLDSQTLETQTLAGGALPMVFQHPMARIKFVIAEESGTHVTVDSIGIAGLHTGGTCTYDGTDMTWGSYSGSAALKITPANALQYGTSYTETTPMMVIPKHYGALTLAVRASWDDWSVVENQTISANVDFNWDPGYSYTYNLTVTPYALIVNVEKFTEQW